MSKPFTDLNLTDEQIASNYSWQQIKNTQNYADVKVFDNVDRNLLVVSNRDNNLDKTAELNDNIILGTNVTVNTTKESITVGHDVTVAGCERLIKIGGGENFDDNILTSLDSVSIGYDNSIDTSNGVLSIGHGNTIGASANGNIALGNNNSASSPNNLMIGNNVVPGVLTSTNTITISNGQLNAVPANGSIVFGGTNNQNVSTGSRIQFLSDGLEPYGGAFTVTLVDGKAAYDGWIPVKYKDKEIYIPFFNAP
jgi:hypothetical protein